MKVILGLVLSVESLDDSSSVAVIVCGFLSNLIGDRRPDWGGTTHVMREHATCRNTFSVVLSRAFICLHVTETEGNISVVRVHTRCGLDRIT